MSLRLNKMNKIIRSPFFYVGDKYKLMSQLKILFPTVINAFIEPFVGGGSVFLNTDANYYLVNDLDPNIYALHKLFYLVRRHPNSFLEELYGIIDEYNLSCSFRGITVPENLKFQFNKTYYAKYNKEGYIKLRNHYNIIRDTKHLYLLLIYGFNHMIRFNRKGQFNLPVGNVDFNHNVYNSILDYLAFVTNKEIEYYNLDYREFLTNLDVNKDDFVYFDPPYLLSNSEYNKLWDKENEIELYHLIDELNEKGIKFGLSNLLINKEGIENEVLSSWMNKYEVYDIESNYISYHDNSIKKLNKEVYITNVKKSET